MIRLALTLALISNPAFGEAVIATRTIKAQTRIAENDVAVADAVIDGALTNPADAIGQEARVTIYAGRPVMAGDLGPPASVERNQIVALAFRLGGLEIVTEGRALERGGSGDIIRVMNLESKSTVSGLIDENGMVRVAPHYEGM